MVEMIQATGLVKHYKEVEALAGLDLSVPEGKVLALLGPNGAGKTTAVRCLATLDPARRRHRHGRRGRRARRPRGGAGADRAVGAVRRGRRAPDRLREPRDGRPALRPGQGAVPRPRPRARSSGSTSPRPADRPSKTYSGGMRRRLDLAGALVAAPPVLILDEPTTGLDVRGPPADVGGDPRPGLLRRHAAADHAVPRGGRPAGRRHPGDRPRQGHRPRHRRRAQVADRRRADRRRPRRCGATRCRGPGAPRGGPRRDTDRRRRPVARRSGRRRSAGPVAGAAGASRSSASRWSTSACTGPPSTTSSWP